MIKKLFKILSLWFLFIPCFSLAWFQWFDIWLEEEITANTNLWYSLELQSNANFITNWQYRIIQFQWYSSYPRKRTFFRNWTWMYVMEECYWWYSCNGSIRFQWFFNYISILDYSYFDNYNSFDPWFTVISEFLNNPIYSNPDKLILWWYENLQTAWLCFWYSDLEQAICFSFNDAFFNNCWWQPQYCTNWVFSYITNSQWFISMDLDYLSSFATSSPFVSESWNPNIPIEAWNWLSWYVYIEVNSWDYVDYFEDKLHFTKDLCYIWTRDLNSVYEDRISYYQWTWYTIFDWFYHLYWTNKISINKLWLWLNTIYFNYRSWFMWENRDQNNEVISNMIMTWQQAITSPQLVFGPWLTNPFLWNPSYLFFIWSTALEWHIDLYTAWQDIALYCYYQMQDYSNDWITFTITDDYDHRWLDNNVAVNSRYKNSQWSLFSWASQIVWQNRDWTPLDYFKSWSWDLYVDDPIQWFSDQFNKFKVSYWQMNPSDLDLWVLPWYIILFMIAIIFFRFLAN